MIVDILVGILGNTAYDTLKRLFKQFGVKEDPIIQLFIDSVKSTSINFFKTYGDTYGTSHSSFLSIEQNWEVILQTVFYGAWEINENSFVLNGLGLSKSDALFGAKKFVEMLNIEMRKNQTLDKILTEKKHIIEEARYRKESDQKLSVIMDTLSSKQFSHSNFPTLLVDQKIKDELKILCRSRFFAEYNTVQSSVIFVQKLIDGELSGGTNSEKSRALAWCARLLSSNGEMVKATECHELAKSLGNCPEIDIAKSLIISNNGDKNLAMSTLAGIDLPISRSVCLFVVIHHEGAERAIDWLETVGLSAKDLDPYGKYLLLMQCINLSNWDTANQIIDMLTVEDLEECPILHHMRGVYYLQSTVPSEWRSSVFNQIPFQAVDFPLAADSTAIHTRRLAQTCFTDAAAIASQLNCFGTAAIDEEYALWLELRDPDNCDYGRRKLESKLHDPKTALRLVRLAVQFKIKLDLKAVEKEIERQIALHGGITQDAAFARFALVFTKKTPDEAVNYITRH